MPMLYRRLGQHNLKVSALCLGTMMFADQTDAAEAGRIVAAAHEAGVNFIDTADVYSRGACEAMLAPLLKPRRNDWFLASKCGNAMSGRVNEGQLSRAWVLRACEDSLKRLETDRIELYYLHRDFNGMNLEEPLRAIQQLLRDGKIRYWGLSNFRGWRIAEAMRVAQGIGLEAPAACQPYYNLLNRMPETEILPACRHYGIGVVPYSPIARGVLTGKYRPGEAPPEGTRVARNDSRIKQTEWRPESLEIAQTLARHAESRGVTLAQWSTAWVLAHPAVSSVIAGPRTLAQWQDYAPALAYGWTAEDEALVDSLVKPGHPSTPGYSDPSYPIDGRPVAGSVTLSGKG